MLEYEKALWDRELILVAGVDEAGRGPLAGPVVAAAVQFDRGFLEAEAQGLLAGLTDSKKLTPSRREHFFELLQDREEAKVSFALVGAPEIDRINILKATHKAMAKALEGLTEVEFALVDGLPVKGLPVPSQAIVKGDASSLSIAAASVVAKVIRDRKMVALDEEHPEYGFARHKGYGTKRHLEALAKHGPCPCHRKSFRPVAQAEFRF